MEELKATNKISPLKALWIIITIILLCYVGFNLWQNKKEIILNQGIEQGKNAKLEEIMEVAFSQGLYQVSITDEKTGESQSFRLILAKQVEEN